MEQDGKKVVEQQPPMYNPDHPTKPLVDLVLIRFRDRRVRYGR
jgi:hypothetical protein